MRNIIFVGVTPIIKAVLNIIELQHSAVNYNLVGIIDDDKLKKGQEYYGINVIGTFKEIEYLIDTYVIREFCICLSEKRIDLRKEYFTKLKEYNLYAPTFVHPGASISNNVLLSEGDLIFDGVTINSDVSIGKNVIVYTKVNIEHDNIIQDHCYISPCCSTSGLVKIEESTFLGTGTVVCPKVTIGKGSYIGAGSVVTKDLKPRSFGYGIPFKEVKKRE
jgi:sugar O-acyltransferase (sialic acid O-acetyltransferase NeuD family)